jgi:hypothetical protein
LFLKSILTFLSTSSYEIYEHGQIGSPKELCISSKFPLLCSSCKKIRGEIKSGSSYDQQYRKYPQGLELSMAEVSVSTGEETVYYEDSVHITENVTTTHRCNQKVFPTKWK